MNKICLIIDSSVAFIQSEVDKFIKDWGLKKTNAITIKTWTGNQNSISLFGEQTFTILNLEDKKDLKKFADLITKDKSGMFKEDWFDPCLIITATTSQGTSKIEKLVETHKGTIVKKDKDPTTTVTKSLNKLKINKDIITMIAAHAGDNYEMLISFINEVGKLSKEEQEKFTIEQAVSMIPTKPGAKKPWEYITPLFAGNIKKTIDLVNKTLINTHVLVLMVFLKKRVDLIYRMKALSMNGVSNDKKQMEIIGETYNYYSVKESRSICNKLSLETIASLANLVQKAESDIKGGSPIKAEEIFLTLIVKVGIAINHNQAIK